MNVSCLHRFDLFRLVFLIWGFVLSTSALALSPSPEELLAEARKGRVEFIKVVSDVSGKVSTIPKKEELFPYLLTLDELSQMETSYGLESLGQSVVKILGFAITNASTKWLRLDTDRADYIELFMKYADNNVRSNLAQQQDAYLVYDYPLQDFISLIEKTTRVIQLATTYKADFFVILSFEDFQANVVKRTFANISNLTDDQIELVISKVTAIAALSEIDAYLHSIASAADTVEKVLRSVRFACIFDRSVKQNPRAPMTLKNAAANSINDALQRLVNLRGVLPDKEIQAAVQVLPAPVLANVVSLIINLSDRLVYRDQLEFLLSLARALSKRLGEFGMRQQQIAIDAFTSRMQILLRIYFNQFEGTYGVKFAHLGGGNLTILHTGGGRIAATLSYHDLSSGLEVPLSVFYFEYDETRNLFQSTQYPFDSTEAQIPGDVNLVLYFKLEENSNCLTGEFGAPMAQDSFRACREQTVTSFDKQVEGAPLNDFTSLWEGQCNGHRIKLRISQVGPRIVGNWMDQDAWIAVPLNFGISNPQAHSVLLTSGQLDVGSFAQARVKVQSDTNLEVEYIMAGRGVQCHTNFRRILR